MDSEQNHNRLIIVSNRLPVVLKKNVYSNWEVTPGAGGLVTALAPVLKNRGGIWIGWPGVSDGKNSGIYEALAGVKQKFGYDLKPVALSAQEVERYYKGFANEIIWPLFHDFTAYCNFKPEYWQAYKNVNFKFASEITRNLHKSDFIWIHDYHLMGVAHELREMGLNPQIAFFLHIPFPPLDIFVKLPWRLEILNSLVQYDIIGFQTIRDRRNFIHCVKTLLKGVRISGRGQVVSMSGKDRDIRVGAFPISIDFDEFATAASAKEVAEKAWYIHEDLPEQQIILGIDRLDYTKGILERLAAYRYALRNHFDLHQKTILVQIVVPSRRKIPQYAALKTEIEQLVGQINGEFTQSGWVPIHYIFRNLSRADLLAYYRTAEIGLITPLNDGMNLVAKEYCAANIDETGVLILSEFAGAAAQFQKEALLVNPHDIIGIAQAIYVAFQMPDGERKRRMKRMRRTVRKFNIFWWVDSFLKAAFAKDLNDFPLMEDYVPGQQPDINQVPYPDYMLS